MPYFTVELFIEALMLVLHSDNAKVRDLVKQILEIYDNELSTQSVVESEILTLYVKLIKEVMVLNITAKDIKQLEILILKFKNHPAVLKDPELLTQLKNVLLNNEEFDQDRIEYGVRKLSNCILFYENMSYIKKMFGRMSNININTSLEKQSDILKDLNSMCTDIIQMNNKMEETELEQSAQFVDLSDRDSMLRSIQKYKKTAVVNVIRTGWQGLNRALGPRRALALGESVVFNALSHHGKSMMLLNFARWTVTLNRMSSDIVNPTVLLYSLENETPHNLMMLFKDMWVNENRQPPPENFDENQIVDYLLSSFQRYGWHLFIERRLGSNFGFQEFVTSFDEYKRKGMTPVVVIVDYLNMMRGIKSTERASAIGNHLVVRELYTNMCNFLKSNNCTFITAHQLNRKAAEIARNNPLSPVKRFTIDCLSDATDPQREVDVAFYMYIESNVLNSRFLTMRIDKHRYDTDTPEHDKFFAYKFGPLGILDDINGDDQTVYNIHAERIDETTNSPIIQKETTIVSEVPHIFS